MRSIKGKSLARNLYLIGINLQGVVKHLGEIGLVIERRGNTLQGNDLRRVKSVGMRDLATLQKGALQRDTTDLDHREDVHQKVTRDMTDLQGGILVTGGDQDLPKDLIEGILDLLLENTEETILVADLGHPQESKENPPKRFILIFKSAKKCSMKTREKFSGMAFNGWLKLKLKSRMSSMSSKSEMSLR